MARGVKRARPKNRPDRPDRLKAAAAREVVEKELTSVKEDARARLLKSQELINDMTAWCGKQFLKAAKAGDVDTVGKLLKILGDSVKRDMATVSKRQVGRPPKTEKANAGVSAPDRAGLLESLTDGQGPTQSAVA